MYVIPNANFDSIQNNGITSVSRLANKQVGPGYWAGLEAGIFRPDSASMPADAWRFCDGLTNSSGVLTITGTYADTTVGTEIAEIWKRAGTVFRPDVEILNAMNYCLQFENFTTLAAFSDLGDNDGDMASTATTAFTAVNTTMTKVTTAGKVPFGPKALRGVASNASNSITTVSMPVSLGTGRNLSVKGWGIISTAVAGVTLNLNDVTNTAIVATSPSITDINPQLVHIPWQNIPTTCKQMTLSTIGSGATSDYAVNALWIYKQDELTMRFPSYVSEGFKVEQIFYGRPTGAASSTSTSTATLYPAQSMEFVPLVENRDFQFMIGHNDANPYGIELNRQQSRWYKEWPLFIEVQRPWSDVTTFSPTDDTVVYSGPTHTLIPRIKLFLLDHVLIPGYPNDQNWLKLRQIAQKELDNAQGIRAPKPIAKTPPYYAGVGMI